MKKLILCVLMALSMIAASAQSTSSGEQTVNLKPTLGGGDLMWKNIDNGFMLGMDFTLGHYIILGGDMLYASSGSLKNNGWDAYLGGRYRYYPVNRLWVEADAAVAYYHSTIEYNSYKDSDSKFGLMLMPRIGFNLFSVDKDGTQLSIFVGYRFDAVDFQFNKAGNIAAGIGFSI